MSFVLSVIAAVLTVNLVVAVVAAARAHGPHTWLLGVLLSGTSGAGVLAVLSSLLGEPALVDAAFALMALALVSVVVRTSAGRGRVGRAEPTATGERVVGE